MTPTTIAQTPAPLNPHGDPNACLACHSESEGNAANAPTLDQVSSVCASCHANQDTLHRAHPLDRLPNETLAAAWPSDFPRTQGRMTCLTCHDIGAHCQATMPPATADTAWLRDTKKNGRADLCLACHGQEAYPRFNVHDQLSEGEPIARTCFWCHEAADDIRTILAADQPYALRQTASSLCTNCHSVSRDHPSGGPHVGRIPSPEMRWYMAAVEMQDHMRLDLPRLTRYAQALDRAPRAIPFDKEGRLTCASCHNPHAQGLWPATDRHAAGAEPAQATDHRLRIGHGKQCLGCHEK